MRRTVSHSVITVLSALLLLCGCRNRDLFTLDGTIVNGSVDSILVFGLDSRFAHVDTIRPQDGKFRWSFRPDTATTLILLLPDGLEYPVFANRGLELDMLVADTSESILPLVTGSTDNELYYDFAISALNDSSFEQTAARIDSFITRDPFSEVAPYLIYAYALKRWHAGKQDIMQLVEKMSGIMQDTPFLSYLMPELKEDDRKISRYIDRMEIYDTTGYKRDLGTMGDKNNYTLICLWASWNGEKGLEARLDMDTLIGLFHGRRLALTDISIDASVERWKESVKLDTLPWFSYIDYDGWNSKLAKLAPDIELPVYIFLTETKRFSFKAQTIQEVIPLLDQKLPGRNKLTQRTPKVTNP